MVGRTDAVTHRCKLDGGVTHASSGTSETGATPRTVHHTAADAARLSRTADDVRTSTHARHAMDPVRLHLLINHVPVVLAFTGTFALVVAMFRARHGIRMYAAASLSLAALTILPTFFTGGLAARALGGPFLPSAAVDGNQLLARVAAALIVVAGLVGTVAWRRLVRYPREVHMPWTLRAALVVTALAATTASIAAVVVGE